MTNRFSLILLISLLFFHSCDNNEDRLDFNVSKAQVKDSILKLNSLMEKIPTDKNGYIKNCFIDYDGYWHISNNVVGKFNQINIDSLNFLKELNKLEKGSLISIMNFLIQNHINGNYRGGDHCYRYSYKAKRSDEYHTTKEIILKYQECNFLYERYEIIDSSSGLVLIKAR